MTKITGTVKNFKNMLEQIMCGSKYPLFGSIILEIDEDIITVNTVDTPRAVATYQKYRGFDIEGSNDVPIETIQVNDALKLFNDNDTLEFIYNENKIILSTKSDDVKDTITIPCVSNDDVTKSTFEFSENSILVNGEEIVFDATSNIDVSYIRNQIKKANYIDPLYHEYIVNINDDVLTLSVGDVNGFETSGESEIKTSGKGIAKSQYMHGYEDIFKTINGEVRINLSENKPMIVTQKTDTYSIKFLIAPVIPQ